MIPLLVPGCVLNAPRAGTRLTWLDSKIYADDNAVPPPYAPLRVVDAAKDSVAGGKATSGFVVSMLDKAVSFNEFGQPNS